MATATSEFQLLIFAVGLGIAVWAHVVSSAESKIDQVNKPRWKLVTAYLQFFSLLILIAIFVSLTIALVPELQSGGLGVGGLTLYMVLLAVLLASLPTAGVVILKAEKVTTEFESFGEHLVSIILLVLIGISVGTGLLMGSSAVGG